MNVDLVFIYLEVFSRAVRIFKLFPDANMSTGITMFYYHIRLCIYLAKNWDLFLKTVSIVSRWFRIVIKGSYSYLLRTATLNVKLDTTKPGRIQFRQLPTSYGKYENNILKDILSDTTLLILVFNVYPQFRHHSLQYQLYYLLGELKALSQGKIGTIIYELYQIRLRRYLFVQLIESPFM